MMLLLLMMTMISRKERLQLCSFLLLITRLNSAREFRASVAVAVSRKKEVPSDKSISTHVLQRGLVRFL